MFRPASHSRLLLALIIGGAMFVLCISGCTALPPQVDHTSDPKLAKVFASYERLVRSCNEDQALDWYSGWMGNAWVNFRKGPARGLCYHWQSAVYGAVLPTVHSVGWEAGGLMVHTDSPVEHHVVLVFDPTKIRYDDILEAPRPRAVYVLDAWRRGRPDLYLLDDWLARDDELASTAVLETPAPLDQLGNAPAPVTSPASE